MAKRKREERDDKPQKSSKNGRKVDAAKPNGKATKSKSDTLHTPVSNVPQQTAQQTTTIQIVIGSYEKALHGFTAAIPSKSTSDGTQSTDENEHDESQTKFADSFLFTAHTSAIRCLALSPPSTDPSQKIYLASGSTDERINLFQLSTTPPSPSSQPSIPTLSGTTVAENPRNREVGSLLHHASSVTALYFPTRSKLLSASEDNTIAVSRTRDWTVMSTIKAPIPKPQGRPSGDTAAPGEVPAGVNDFAVHPSMKLMVSVGKGEKCMRLWNLVTGRKAAVLQFERDMLSAVGEGKYASGEGRTVCWDNEGEELVVGFERGAVVYGLDSKPRSLILPAPRTKIHQIRYLPAMKANILAISIEDGRIVFYDTKASSTSSTTTPDSKIPSSQPLAQLGGPAAGLSSRTKDFAIIPLPSSTSEATSFIFVTGSSDGAVRIWDVSAKELLSKSTGEEDGKTRQVGVLRGTYETGHRITCLVAFIMGGEAEGKAEGKENVEGNGVVEDGDSDSDESE